MASLPDAFSIVIPAFNAQQTVVRCLDSLRDQHWGGWEAIVVDDCSNDGTAGLVETYAHKEPRVRLVRLPHNLGSFGAKLSGLPHCRGGYIGFMDADDFLAPGAYEQLSRKIDAYQPDIVLFGSYRLRLNGRRGIKVAFPAERLYEEGVLEKYACLDFGSGVMWNKLYRRPLVEGLHFQPTQRRVLFNEDYLFNLACFAQARTVLTVPQLYYEYVERSGSLSERFTGARAFVAMHESFADALELFANHEERVLNAIVRLYATQLQLPYCRVQHLEELRPYQEPLRRALERIGRIKPEFACAYIHSLPRKRSPAWQRLFQKLRRAGLF